MKTLITILLTMIICFPLGAQDLTQFELVDATTLGIPKILMDRWGAVAADIDNNGWPDLFLVKWRGSMGSQMYLNNEGMFQEIYSNSPDIYDVEVAQNATRVNIFADYDNDGDKDFFFGGDYEMFLFQNNNNVFTNVSATTGVKSRGVPGFVSIYGIDNGAWGDFDLDGDLDLAVCQTNNKDFFLFRNDGGTFVDVAAEVGLTGVLPLGNDGDRGSFNARMQWIDFDLDGDPDLCAGWFIFQNDNGTFTEVSQSLNFNPSHDIEFSDWFDYDNDGDFDFLKIVHWADSPTVSELWKNENGTFIDVTPDVGLEAWGKNAMASLNVGDYDNDGDQDFFVQVNDHTDMDMLMLNEKLGPGDFVFADVASYVGLTTKGDRKGAAFLDYDMDGNLDLFLPAAEYGSLMFHNLGSDNNWIGFMLEGTQSNRDAIGTLVTVFTGEEKQMKYTKVPSTWKIQDNPYVHFGIGQAITIDSVVFHWPLGLKETYPNLMINQYHKIKEGESSSAVSESEISIPSEFSLSQNYPNPFNSSTQINYSLVRQGQVFLKIFNMQGQLIRTLVDKFQKSGEYKVSWDGKSEKNVFVPSGVYIYELSSPNQIKSKKMLYIQ